MIINSFYIHSSPSPLQNTVSTEKLDDFDPVEVYVAIADFYAAAENNISLSIGQHVQVGGSLSGSRDCHRSWSLHGYVTVT